MSEGSIMSGSSQLVNMSLLKGLMVLLVAFNLDVREIHLIRSRKTYFLFKNVSNVLTRRNPGDSQPDIFANMW